ncbi:MAG: biotin/lipoyl-binding protein [Gammaproteobacteria bacterium]|nr:biotin/lipoyl-binding protein [Gammaproteobacteria bacterium]
METSNSQEQQWLGLRPDLIIHPGPPGQMGERSWVVEDPVSGNHYQLGPAEGELLLRLASATTIDQAVEQLRETSAFRPPREEVDHFVEMLRDEGLAQQSAQAAIALEQQRQQSTEGHWLQRLLHGYAYSRLPLLRPDARLTRTLPTIKLLWSLQARALYVIAGILGLLLTFQQLDQYLESSAYLLTPGGALAFVVILVLLKMGHELCHAYTAKALGLHVRSMGLAFIFLWPILYTDTTDAWRLADRRQRLRISAAGVIFELVVAGLALLTWALLPDGILRSIMFFLSSTSLISSLAINLNPFMRFDGYYMLMDSWGIDNLQPRALALMKHRMRRIVLDWQGAVPEQHPHQRRMVAYALLTTLYRIVIAIVIALVIYHFFFPALGLLLLGVALWIFILYPIVREVKYIVAHRQLLGSRSRLSISGVVLLLIMALMVVPLPQPHRAWALLLTENTHRLNAPAAGELVTIAVTEGQSVVAGELIATIRDEALEREARQLLFDQQSMSAILKNLTGGGEQGSYRSWLLTEQERLHSAIAKVREAIALLEVRSPAAGRIAYLNEALYAGAFIEEGGAIATISGSALNHAKLFIHEQLIDRFIAGNIKQLTLHTSALLDAGISAQVQEISPFPVGALPNQALYDFAGGPIISQGGIEHGRPRDAHFAVTIDFAELPEPLPYGTPGWTWLWLDSEPLINDAAGWLVQNLASHD